MNSINNVSSNAVAFNGKFNLKSLWSRKKTVTAPAAEVATGVAVTAGTALASLGVINTKSRLTPLEQAKMDNPELYNALHSQTHAYYAGRDGDYVGQKRDFSDGAIVTLIKYNKEDPDFAYALSKHLKQTESRGCLEVSQEGAELIAQALKNEPETLEKISKFTPNKKAQILNDKTIMPEVVDTLINNGLVCNLLDTHKLVKEKFIEAYNNDKEPVLEILNNVTFDFGQVLSILPSYVSDKETTEKLISILRNEYKNSIPDNYQEIYDCYKECPGATTTAIHITKGNISKSLSIPKLAHEINSRQQIERAEEKKYAESKVKAKETGLDKVLAKVAPVPRGIWYKMIDEYSSCPEVLDRIIDDGRFHQALELKDLYIQNPNKEITDKQVEKELDPVGRFFK